MPRFHSSLRLGLAALTWLAIAAPTLAQGSPVRTLEVTGRGEVAVPPDLAVVDLAVETTARTAAEATDESSRRAAAMIAAVRERLGARDEIRTTRVSLQPQYGARRPGDQSTPEIIGYIARNDIALKIRDLDAVGRLIDAALGAGANRTQGLRFEREDRTPVRQALAQAGQDARAQAQATAEALGVELLRIINVSTSQNDSPPIYREQLQMRAMAEAAATPVETGDLELSATVTVVWEIQ